MLSKLTQSVPRYISQLAKVEEIKTASIDAIQFNVIEDQDDVWMIDLVKFFTTEDALEDEQSARKVQLRASMFEMRNARLYKRSYEGPLLSA